MQEIDALKTKSLAELRQIGKALGINDQLKKKDLIDRIVAVATGEVAEEQNSSTEAPIEKPKRGRRPRVSTTRVEDAKMNIAEGLNELGVEAETEVVVVESVTEAVADVADVVQTVAVQKDREEQPKKRGRKPKNAAVQTEEQMAIKEPNIPQDIPLPEYEIAHNDNYTDEEEIRAFCWWTSGPDLRCIPMTVPNTAAPSSTISNPTCIRSGSGVPGRKMPSPLPCATGLTPTLSRAISPSASRGSRTAS